MPVLFALAGPLFKVVQQIMHDVHRFVIVLVYFMFFVSMSFDLKGITCPQEAEFRAYDILLNLNEGDILR